MEINLETPESTQAVITVFGVGGAGGNAVNNMIEQKLQGAKFVVANTDAQALTGSLCENKLKLGNALKGLGAGAEPEIGRVAAQESIEEIKSYLEGSNMLFITAGMGGGTGTGASPVIAEIAREMNILTVAVVTKPFSFEGQRRMRVANAGLESLQKHVDTLIVVENQNLFRVANEQTTFKEAFQMADEVLHAGVKSITDLIHMPGLINLDFADIKTVISEMGKAMMGTGEAEGEDRAMNAAESALSNPLLDQSSMHGASGVLINVTCGSDITLNEVQIAVNRIKEEVDHDANIIFGSAFDEQLAGRIRVSIVATGIEGNGDSNDINHLGYKKNLLQDNEYIHHSSPKYNEKNYTNQTHSQTNTHSKTPPHSPSHSPSHSSTNANGNFMHKTENISSNYNHKKEIKDLDLETEIAINEHNISKQEYHDSIEKQLEEITNQLAAKNTNHDNRHYSTKHIDNQNNAEASYLNNIAQNNHKEEETANKPLMQKIANFFSLGKKKEQNHNQLNYKNYDANNHYQNQGINNNNINNTEANTRSINNLQENYLDDREESKTSEDIKRKPDFLKRY